MGKNALLLLSVLVFVTLCSCAIKRQKEGVATLVEIRHSERGGSTEWIFNDDKGKKYEIDAGDAVGLMLGMKRVVVYDSLHPDINNELDCTRPVFTPEEKTGKTVCTIIFRDKCYPSKRDNEIHFGYHVNGRYYESFQPIPPRKDTICYKIGDKFEGEYWQENPKRVIIHIDKPIK
jgi:hypothetical protein